MLNCQGQFRLISKVFFAQLQARHIPCPCKTPPSTVHYYKIPLLKRAEKVTLKPGTSGSHFRATAKNPNRPGTPSPGTWNSTPDASSFFFPINSCDPTMEASWSHLGPEPKVEEHCSKGTASSRYPLGWGSWRTQWILNHWSNGQQMVQGKLHSCFLRISEYTGMEHVNNKDRLYYLNTWFRIPEVKYL